MHQAPKLLLVSANDNIPTSGPNSGSISPEFVALAGRVMFGRESYRRAGLSARGTRVLQALGYLAPDDLPRPDFARQLGEPTLLKRAEAVQGCGPRTMDALQGWLAKAW